MGSIAAIFDTNILIDYIKGISQAATELNRFPDRAISVITWMEVMAGTSDFDANRMRSFLSKFQFFPITTAVAERAASLRRGHRIKLPDAVIQATAQVEKRLLVTRNTRDFSSDDPGVRIPYQI